MVGKGADNILATKLPFDQFSRQKIVSYLIDESFRKTTNEKFKIIDIGGHKGKTAEFQPNDAVTILDVYDESYSNYIKGDATKTNFPIDSFDIACSFDVLEHIPQDKRRSFIDEALKISSIGVFLAVPIDIDKKVSTAEVILNNFHINLLGSDHKWLKEHIDYKIPNKKEIIQLAHNSGANLVSTSSNQIGDWQLMQMLLFASSVVPDIVGEVNNINTWYNRNTLFLDSSVDVGYREIIFLSKTKKNVESVSNAINKLRRVSGVDPLMTINKKTFIEFSNTLSFISKKYRILYDKYKSVDKMKADLINELYILKEQQKDDNAHIIKLRRELADIHNSVSWKLTKPLRYIFGIGRKSQNKKSKIT